MAAVFGIVVRLSWVNVCGSSMFVFIVVAVLSGVGWSSLCSLSYGASEAIRSWKVLDVGPIGGCA